MGALTWLFPLQSEHEYEGILTRYREVDLDGFRDIHGKPEDAFVNLQQEK